MPAAAKRVRYPPRLTRTPLERMVETSSSSAAKVGKKEKPRATVMQREGGPRTAREVLERVNEQVKRKPRATRVPEIEFDAPEIREPADIEFGEPEFQPLPADGAEPDAPETPDPHEVGLGEKFPALPREHPLLKRIRTGTQAELEAQQAAEHAAALNVQIDAALKREKDETDRVYRVLGIKGQTWFAMHPEAHVAIARDLAASTGEYQLNAIREMDRLGRRISYFDHRYRNSPEIKRAFTARFMPILHRHASAYDTTDASGANLLTLIRQTHELLDEHGVSMPVLERLEPQTATAPATLRSRLKQLGKQTWKVLNKPISLSGAAPEVKLKKQQVLGAIAFEELPDAIQDNLVGLQLARENRALSFVPGVFTGAALPFISKYSAEIQANPYLASATGILFGGTIGSSFFAAKSNLDVKDSTKKAARAVTSVKSLPVFKPFFDKGATHIAIDGNGKMHFIKAPLHKDKAFRPLIGRMRAPLVETQQVATMPAQDSMPGGPSEFGELTFPPRLDAPPKGPNALKRFGANVWDVLNRPIKLPQRTVDALAKRRVNLRTPDGAVDPAIASLIRASGVDRSPAFSNSLRRRVQEVYSQAEADHGKQGPAVMSRILDKLAQHAQTADDAHNVSNAGHVALHLVNVVSRQNSLVNPTNVLRELDRNLDAELSARVSSKELSRDELRRILVRSLSDYSQELAREGHTAS